MREVNVERRHERARAKLVEQKDFTSSTYNRAEHSSMRCVLDPPFRASHSILVSLEIEVYS